MSAQTVERQLSLMSSTILPFFHFIVSVRILIVLCILFFFIETLNTYCKYVGPKGTLSQNDVTEPEKNDTHSSIHYSH